MKKDLIAGLDEAGRGSWAGPVVAAAVILPANLRLPGLNDSKLVPKAQREILFKKIMSRARVGIGMASHDEIGQKGLLWATEQAFLRAVEDLGVPHPKHLLVDGRDKFRFPIPHTSIVRGDQKERCISAASIIAKVYRDRYMEHLHQKYPEYAFNLNKGYGTKRHHAALKKFGVCEQHRKNYKPILSLLCEQRSFL